MTSEVELKEIKSLLLKLNKKVDGLNDLVEERLIGYEEPTKEDVQAIKEYESALDQTFVMASSLLMLRRKTCLTA
jgi:hypothetical protein